MVGGSGEERRRGGGFPILGAMARAGMGWAAVLVVACVAASAGLGSAVDCGSEYEGLTLEWEQFTAKCSSLTCRKEIEKFQRGELHFRDVCTQQFDDNDNYQFESCRTNECKAYLEK